MLEKANFPSIYLNLASIRFIQVSKLEFEGSKRSKPLRVLDR